ncbi:MAG: hypothetical protein H0U04_00990, partial [Rubrobacter sp.]|nr:hypothetical protein [Rubrobacter sp.]
MQTTETPEGRGDRVLALWHELGGLYAAAEGERNRAVMLGFTVLLTSGALVLASGFFLGTGWAGTPASPGTALTAAAVPIAAGFLAGSVLILWERMRRARRRGAVERALAEEGLDPARPARDGLSAYYDAQLILLRSEYEYLRFQGANRTGRIFEASFGFMPEDPFETGPLNVAPDTEGMRSLRERWERRLAMRRARGMEASALGLREDLAYRVFPREMTVPVELSMRSAYLAISCDLLRRRYGRNPAGNVEGEGLRARITRDLAEHAALT